MSYTGLMAGRTTRSTISRRGPFFSTISHTLTFLVGLSVIVPLTLVGGFSFAIARYSFERTAMGQIEDALEGALATVEYFEAQVEAGTASIESALVDIRRLFCGPPIEVTIAAQDAGEARSFLAGFAKVGSDGEFGLVYASGRATLGPSALLDAFMDVFNGLSLDGQYQLVNGPRQVRIRFDLSRAILRMRDSGYVFSIKGSDPGYTGSIFELFHPTLTMVDVSSITNSHGERVGLAISQRQGQSLGDGSDGYIRYGYDWANTGETTDRRKITLLRYFEPWNWVIAAGLYEDEYFAPLSSLAAAIALGLILFGTLFVALARKTGRVLIGARAETLSQAFSKVTVDGGNSSFPTDWNDEFGDMARAADAMSRSLAERNRRLAEYRAFLSAVLDAVPGPIFALDRSDRVTMANASARERFSADNRTDSALPEALSRYLPDVRRVREDGAGRSYARETVETLQRRVFSVSILPVPNSDDGSVVLVLFDLTELDHAEEGLRLAQKIEVAGTIAAGMAHDMNNLLGGILGCSSLLRADAEEGRAIPPVELLASISIIEGAVRQASDFICRVLDFGRSGERPFDMVDLSEILDEALILARRSSPRDVHFRWDRPEGLAMIRGDAIRLEQVFLNLLLNARDAVTGMRPPSQAIGGTVSITLTVGQLQTGAPAWQVAFTDDGVGMDEETMARAFEPFFSRKVGSGGTGLGLAMVRHILNQHGGQVSIESVFGTGSTIRVLIPVT